MTILNAHALYLCKTGNKPTLSQFHLELVRQLLEKYLEPRRIRKGGRPSGDTPMRLTMRHFPKYIPATEKKAGPCRPCVVCKFTQRREKKRRETRYMCEECGVALCAAPCFGEFHQMKNY
uniref:PiggyBac transposable element-derived protein 4 C-terminal zinc-finger domain-containing protein n=1 Tax=Cuerna arida TaxID=1464854 RepID=A0A1B6GCG2_9HEMI